MSGLFQTTWLTVLELGMARHIIIKMTRLKNKEKILKVAREKQVVAYKGAPIRMSSDFSTETFQTINEQYEIFKVMKSKDL